MKKLTLALAFIIVLSSISMLMTSCGGKNKQIIGTWECISDESLDVSKSAVTSRNIPMRPTVFHICFDVTVLIPISD